MAGATDRAARLARARDYPYAYPGGSYTWCRGRVAPFDPAETAGLTPVLALGSNRSPGQLQRKFGDRALIPVEAGRLDGFDIVYSAHITGYGAVPATLATSPGTTVGLAVTWLGEAELEAMHATELGNENYLYALLEDVALTLDGGARLDAIHLYISRRGLLTHDGGPVALAAVAAEGRRHGAMTTGEVLEAVRARVAPGHDPDAFVLHVAGDTDYRREVSTALAQDAAAFEHPVETIKI
ncbi:MAG: hypothetical protein QF654_10130 [Alphaproteobacteria bacterium]|nr:hypothetical protein [Alphaproteobacteria bacterium]